MADLAAVVARTLAERTARLRTFIARDAEQEWRETGYGTSHFTRRLTHWVLRPRPPDAPPVFAPETEYEYLFDGARRWFRNRGETEWCAPQDAAARRHIADPTWVLDALCGARVSRERPSADDPIEAILDIVAAGQALRQAIDCGRGQAALMWRPRLRRWRRAVPARIWLDSNERLKRVEHLAPPWSRVFAVTTWQGVTFAELGEPVDLPEPPTMTGT